MFLFFDLFDLDLRLGFASESRLLEKGLSEGLTILIRSPNPSFFDVHTFLFLLLDLLVQFLSLLFFGLFFSLSYEIKYSFAILKEIVCGDDRLHPLLDRLVEFPEPACFILNSLLLLLKVNKGPLLNLFCRGFIVFHSFNLFNLFPTLISRLIFDHLSRFLFCLIIILLLRHLFDGFDCFFLLRFSLRTGSLAGL